MHHKRLSQKHCFTAIGHHAYVPVESHAALDATSILAFFGRWIPGSSPRMTTERLIVGLMRLPLYLLAV